MNPLPPEWLRSPDTGQSLSWEPDWQAYTAQDEQFAFRQGVAYLLPRRQTLAAPTDQHQTSGQPFDYHEHYQADAEAFNYTAEWQDPAAVHENQRLRQTILRQLPADAGRVLDLGCGAAWVAEALLPAGVIVVSADISTVNPERALQRFPSEHHFGLVADAYHLPFRHGLFDAVIASEIIEHVPNPAGFLQALLPVLAPGGVLIVTTPYNEELQYSLCIHCNRPTPHNAHLHSFTEEKLISLLPAEARASARTLTFANKALLRLRTHRLLGLLPYPAWRLIDQLANMVIRKPARLLLLVRRPPNP